MPPVAARQLAVEKPFAGFGRDSDELLHGELLERGARLGDPAQTQMPYPTTIYRAPEITGANTISYGNLAFHQETSDVYFIVAQCIKRLRVPPPSSSKDDDA